MICTSRLRAAWAAGACWTALLVGGQALAQDETTSVEGVVVFGRAEQRIGQAVTSTEGAIAGADLTLRPLLRTGELLEGVPGMMVTQHSGSGKANQYFLRGFNLDHGTDFGLFIDGVPINFRTHGHGQGYLDVGGLIPEVVGRMDYRKGPYRADLGDFTMAGAGIITTRSTFDDPFVRVDAGAFDWKRVVGGTSFEALGGNVLLAAEGKTYDGPWALPEGLRHFSFYGKYGRDISLGAFSVSLSVYDAQWHPTEQIPERAIGTLVPDAFGSLDRTLFGQTSRQILSVQLDGEKWQGGVYAQNYDWDLLSNFTFFLDDPVNGDQLQQVDSRRIYGGRLQRQFQPTEDLSLIAGAEARYDDISEVGLYHTVQGQRIAVTNLSAVEEGSAALYGEAKWKPNERLTVFGGLRGESFDFDVRALGGSSHTRSSNAALLMPKAGIAYEVAPGVAVYADWGHGFHSNDSRGATDPVNPAPGMVRGIGEEVGVRFERNNVVLTAAYWWIDVDSELIFVGDSGAVEPSSAGHREGLELTGFWRPARGLAIDGVFTASDGYLKGAAGPEFIPGALKITAEVGLTYARERWNVSARYRHLGEHALVEDNSVTASPTTVVNLRAAWTPGDIEVFGELLNVFDSHDTDIEYLYETYLPTIDLTGPQEGVNSRAVEPRMVRLGLRKAFR